jgi:hypothetical protein
MIATGDADDYWELDADQYGGTAAHEYNVQAPADTAGVQRGLVSDSALLVVGQNVVLEDAIGSYAFTPLEALPCA